MGYTHGFDSTWPVTGAGGGKVAIATTENRRAAMTSDGRRVTAAAYSTNGIIGATKGS